MSFDPQAVRNDLQRLSNYFANPVLFWRNRPVEGTVVSLFLVSVLALGAAYISEYGFGLRPCELCLLQRPPYFVVAGLAVVAWWWPNRFAKQMLLLLMAVTLIIGTAIAGYHTGVEQGWWAGPTACADTAVFGSMDELRESLREAAVVRCDQPAIELFGVITMASLNFLISLALTVFAFIGLSRSDLMQQE
jgi:disulfide bond formation protein DsbB